MAKKPVRIEWTPSGRKMVRKKLQDLKESSAAVFHYPKEKDLQIIDFTLIPGVALQWRKENPLWFQLIGSPGSGKTQHIMMYEGWSKCMMVSRLTKNSLISGFRNEGDDAEDPSLLKLLDGKLFIVKDFTCILQGPKEERDSVIGQLRDIYDGTASRAFGNIGLQEYTSRFNILLAVTNIIDGFHGVNSQLGERFVSRREYSVHREKITEAAFDNIISGRRNAKWAGLQAQFHDFLDTCPRIAVKDIEWSSEMKKRAVAAAQFTATCRSHVVRERDGRSIASRPSPEVGSRLVTQLVQTVAASCLLHGQTAVDDLAWDFGGVQLLRDTLSTSITWTLFQINKITNQKARKGEPLSWGIRDLLPLTRLGYATTEQIVSNLYHNGIITAKYSGTTGRKSTRYQLTDKTSEIIKFTHFFKDYSDEEVDIATLRNRVKSRERNYKRESEKEYAEENDDKPRRRLVIKSRGNESKSPGSKQVKG